MSTTGHRHPFLGKYKARFRPPPKEQVTPASSSTRACLLSSQVMPVRTCVPPTFLPGDSLLPLLLLLPPQVAAKADGTVVALDMQLYANTGHSMDLTFSIVERAMFHSDNVYRIPNMRVRGFLCRTNTPSNTAFRGFGGPQGAVFCEMWMDRVAKELGLPPDEVRRRNFYQEGDTTHFGQPLLLCRVKACWDEVVESSGYAARRAAAAQFNAQNRYKKRGVAVTPVKFGISFTSTFLNQGGALVHIYTDGSVLVTIGGVEMGQGLFTKCTQVAASVLGVPMGKVFISETSTDKVPNASPTAASASADIYGEATYQACLQLKARGSDELLPCLLFSEEACLDWSLALPPVLDSRPCFAECES